MSLLEKALASSVAKPKAAMWTTAIWGALALAAILPIGLLGFYAYDIAADSVHGLVLARNASVATLTADLMGRELERRLDLVKALAAMPGFVEAVKNHDEEAVRTRLRVAVTNYGGIDRAVVSDPDALLWSDYPRAPEVLGRRFPERDWYRGVTNGWKPYVSEVFFRRAEPQMLVVGVAAPIWDGPKPLGILLHHYRLGVITKWIRHLSLGRHDCVFVIDHTGTVAAHSRSDLVLQNETYEEYGKLEPIQAALSGSIQTAEYYDPLLKTNMVATFMPLKVGRHHWAVVSEETVEEAYAPIRELRLHLLGSAGILALAGLVVVLLLARTTERSRRLHRQLTEERNLLRRLIDNLPDLVYVKDPESRFLLGNLAMARLAGQNSPEDLVGKTDLDLFPPDLAARYRADELEVSRSGLPMLNREEPVAEQDGTRRWLSTTRAPLRDSEGTIVGVVGIGRDVTRRKRAEEGLRASEERLQAMLDNTTAVVYLKDIRGRYLLVNRQYEILFHAKRDQIVGKTDYDMFPRETADALTRNDRQVVEAGCALQIEEVVPQDDGLHTYVSVKFPLHDGAGQIYAVCGISTDITERKRAEGEVQRAREMAEEANKAKSEFLANMSHELRTPLNSVIGFANLLLKNKEGRLAREELAFLERIVTNGRHLLALINQILDLSKIEARRVELESRPVDLDVLIQEVLGQFEAQARERSLSLTAEAPKNLARIVMDESKLRQVLNNLVGNAVKFTEKGGVTVRVASDEASRRPVRIDVCDTGIGIRPDRQEVIFEAFQQADASTARKYGGTGLGLTVSKALCELMGCRIRVQSQPGQGSTFSVILPPPTPAAAPGLPPTAPAASQAPGPAPASPPAKGSGKLVLLIDDEADSRTLLSHLVEECGCRAVAAEGGEAGLRLARELRPDLIVLDLLMPRLDGWQVLKELKADPELRVIPVVVASVVGTESRGTLLCAQAVLQKPVSREDLARVLQPFAHPKVLVVEDNEDHRQLMAAHLAGKAAALRMAANGQEAWQALADFTPDLILLDLMMPQMDGMSFLGALRKDPRYRHLPVLVVTARDISVQEQERLAREAQVVLRKSNDWGEDLEALLNRILQTPAGAACDPAPPRHPPPAATATRPEPGARQP